MKIWISYILTFMTISVAAQDPLYVHMNEDGIHLRWQGKYDARNDGYKVYRQQEGALWELITPELLELPKSTEEARNRSGRKSELLYALLGKTGGPITPSELEEAATDSRLFESTCIANTELSWMLCERFTDKTAQQGVGYAYKVVWVDGNKETDWVESKMATYSVQRVPSPGEVNMVEGDGQISLDLEPNPKDLKAGDAITWNVYRSSSPNGPFEKLNYENSLPLSVSQNGASAQPKLAHLDRFLTNGETYYYRVKLVNVAGVESDFSRVYQAVPKAGTSVFAIKGFKAEVLASTAIFNWEITRANALYEIYAKPANRDEYRRVQRGITALGAMRWIDIDFQPGPSVEYFMKATLDNSTVFSDTLTLMAQDNLPPKTPVNVEARLIDSLVVEISWETLNESDLLGYEIERLTENTSRAGLKINSGYFQENRFLDTLDSPTNRVFYYWVFALDKSYQSSKGSDLARVVLPDSRPPQTPQFWNLKYRNDSLYMRWSAVPDSDFNSFLVYSIRSEGETQANLITESKQTEWKIAYSDTGRVGVFVQASDTSGNVSSPSDTLFVRVKPAPPRAPDIVSVQKEDKGLKIDWEQSDSNHIHRLLLARIDPVSGKRLDVWQGGPEVGSFSDLYADPDKSWRYELYTYDKEWIEGESSYFLYEPPEK